jgi:predicted small lipoprotein YifL
MKAILSQSSMFILVILSVLTLSGCGQSGVLYLPEQPPQSKNHTPDPKNLSTQHSTLNDVEPINDKE